MKHNNKNNAWPASEKDVNSTSKQKRQRDVMEEVSVREKASLSFCDNQRNRRHRKTVADSLLGVRVPRKPRTTVIKRWIDERDSNTKRVSPVSSSSTEMNETELEVAEVLSGLKIYIELNGMASSSTNALDPSGDEATVRKDRIAENIMDCDKNASGLVELKEVTEGKGSEMGKQDNVRSKEGLVKGLKSSSLMGKAKFDIDLNGKAFESTTMENYVEMEMEGSAANKDRQIKGKQKLIAVGERELPTLDQNQGNICSSKQATVPKAEQRALVSSLPFAVSGWPNGFSPVRYTSPFPTELPTTEGANYRSTTYQAMPLQTQRKRCATHAYIAQNISLHQKLTQPKILWPATAGSISLSGTSANNANSSPSAENMTFGTPSQVYSLSLNVNHLLDNRQVAENSAKHNKGKSYDSNSENGNRLVLQPAQQPALAGDLLRGPTYMFHPSRHQSTATAANNQTGPARSATSVMNSLQSSSPASKVPTFSSPSPAATGSMSFSYPHMSAKEAQFFTILPNNGYSFPVIGGVGMPPAFRGIPAQPLPFFNRPFYMPQVFNQSQYQQQQRPHHSNILPAQPDTSASNGSSSSQKQILVQRQKAAENSGSGHLKSTNMHSQYPQKGQLEPRSSNSHKSGASTNVENVFSFTDKRASQVQKNFWSQNITVPVQPSTMSAGGCGGGTSGNQADHQSQKQPLKGAQMTPSQAFPIHIISHNMNGGDSYSVDSGKKAMEKSSSYSGQALAFNNPYRTVNFMSCPPSQSVSVGTTTTASVASNLQQHPHFELHKQSVAASLSKMSTNGLPSSLGLNSQNNSPVFTKPLAQCSSAAQYSQHKSPAKTSDVQFSSTVMSTISVPKFLRQQGSATDGIADISSGGNMSTLSPQGQEMSSNQPSPPLALESPPSTGAFQTYSAGCKGDSSPQSQQTDKSATINGKKSSAAESQQADNAATMNGKKYSADQLQQADNAEQTDKSTNTNGKKSLPDQLQKTDNAQKTDKSTTRNGKESSTAESQQTDNVANLNCNNFLPDQSQPTYNAPITNGNKNSSPVCGRNEQSILSNCSSHLSEV